MKTAIKFVFCFCLAFVLFTATSAFSQESTDEKPAAANGNGAAAKVTPTAAGTLSEEQIAAFLMELPNEKTGIKLQFQASFDARKIAPEEKRRYVRSGKIPIRLTCALFEVKELNGKETFKRATGVARFYIMDPDGKVIEKKSAPLDKMCPS